MSMQHIFSIIMALFGVLGIVGASRLSMTRGPNLGPGAAPMAYSIILLLLAVGLLLSARSNPKIVWRDLLQAPVRDGYIFFGFALLLLFMMYMVGTVPAMFVFSVISLLHLKRISFAKNLIFSICWVSTLYVLFVRLLSVPFESGMLFK